MNWNDLDHELLNSLIAEMTSTDDEYMAACRRAGTLFCSGDTEERLAKRASADQVKNC